MAENAALKELEAAENPALDDASKTIEELEECVKVAKDLQLAAETKLINAEHRIAELEAAIASEQTKPINSAQARVLSDNLARTLLKIKEDAFSAAHVDRRQFQPLDPLASQTSRSAK